MGNCIWNVKKSSMQSSFGSESNRNLEDLINAQSTDDDDVAIEKTSLLGEAKNALSTPKAGLRVKIKISKKQLEEVLRNADSEGLSSHEVLARLTSYSDRFEAHPRSSTPALQSIPESG